MRKQVATGTFTDEETAVAYEPYHVVFKDVGRTDSLDFGLIIERKVADLQQEATQCERMIPVAAVAAHVFKAGEQGALSEVALHPDGTNGPDYFLGTLSDSENGKGIGKGLFIRMMQLTRAKGYHGYTLTCVKENIPAFRMYKQFGAYELPETEYTTKIRKKQAVGMHGIIDPAELAVHDQMIAPTLPAIPRNGAARPEAAREVFYCPSGSGRKYGQGS